jgi:D-alanyl-D-alanine carboxypeptidase
MKKLKKLLFVLFVCTSLTTNLIPVSGNKNLFSYQTVYADTGNSLPLIFDSHKVDYMSYIPEIKCSEKVKNALNIKNCSMSLDASSAILLNANEDVMYYKNATKAVFPASTAKLLSSLVILDWCKADEKITVGKEVKLIASDSSKAGLIQGESLDVGTLLEAMLLPSGNDAAYVGATYVGRKALGKEKGDAITAIKEFARLMNKKAEEVGAENSCFISPDGYDAIGQYTTAYDMGRIAVAAVNSKTISGITQKSCVNTTLISGEKRFWRNSNALIRKDSYVYNPNVIGLKTGTTTMAGSCLISAARSQKGTVISVVMHSTSAGRWADSNKLLDYGLKQLE